MLSKIKEFVREEIVETRLILKSVPALALTFFVIAVVCMNLLASKAIVETSWIALDAGILVSWLTFLSMDMIVKRFGPKAAIKINITAAFINIVVMAVFSIAAIIPGEWGLNDYSSGINWWIIGASTSAFIISGVTDAFINWAIKKTFKKNPNSVGSYIASSYISTFVGQFIDNLVFALVFTFPASYIGVWGMEPMTVLALFMFAIVGAVVELVCQIIFSPIGYKVAERWRKQGRGQEYLDYMQSADRSL